MKRIYQLLSIALLTAVLAACGSSAGEGDKIAQLEGLKKQRAELDGQISALEAELLASGELEENGGNKVLVSVKEMKPQSFVHKVEIRGNVSSRKNVLLSAETMGKIISIPVTDGQKVYKGQLLLSLDTDVINANIKQVKSQLELATQVFDRQKRLWDQKIGTEIQYLQAKTNKESLESQLATLRAQLEMSQLRAPFAGIVDDIPAKIGEVAQPGMPLIRIVNPDDAYIAADVSESFLGKFSTGQEVEIYFPSQDKTVTSKIKSVGQSIKAENRTFELEVNLPKLDFPYQPNQVVVLTLVDYKKDQAFVVPTKVVQSDKEGNYVYTIVSSDGEQMAKKVHVSIGSSYDLKTEVKEGLKAGQKVVVAGHRDLTNDVVVSITK